MKHQSHGFTIVELLIVIVIIGILATIVIVAYNGITTKARQATLQSDLSNSRSKLEIANATDGQYPSSATVNANKSNYITQSGGNTLAYNADTNGTAYCVSAVGSDNITYVISNLLGPVKGYCSTAVAVPGDGSPLVVADGVSIQDITNANCPSTRTRTKDARDNHSYWVQKLTDGKCWMLTNLAYGGGGTNTYSDTRTLTNGTGGSATYTVAQYYVVPSTTNYTTEPTAPSTSTNGTGQYGYLYNWCAAMGAPISTDPNPSSACANATTPAPDTSRSICPAGWRLPVGNGAEFTALNTAVNSGSTTSDSGLIGTNWLGQYSGNWASGFNYQGSVSYYWSSSQYSAAGTYDLYFDSTDVLPTNNFNKYIGFAVRCVAAV